MMRWAPMLRQAAALGVPPDQFWRLSLKEWRHLAEGSAGLRPLGRQELDALMSLWPDGNADGDEKV